MLTRKDFTKNSEGVIRWIEQYFEILPSLPVKAKVKPGSIYQSIPPSMPDAGCSIQELLTDTTELILPGITHWQHPNFHAYFPANSSIESLYAEMITSAIAAQCMIWDTSPAAAELEERMMEWMRDAMGLPSEWEGVIQDTASTASLVAIICARERVTNFNANENGVPSGLRVYCSAQTHSSIEKAVTICGIGRKNLVKIKTDSQHRLTGKSLEIQIKNDLDNDLQPCCVVAAIGTTGTVAVDDLESIGKVCQKYNLWLHIDAAYAGSALFLPEYRWMMNGGELADSFVFNPHKWLFTNFDCTAYYVKDANHLIRTFEILPEYLKTQTRGEVNDYRDWGIPLGRRFRALKLWY
ncbi:MAG: aminotransferase class I/II-fold pyridoxal phosphate-dependent enzyme, partial [Saprospiraceae bacterium]|nr:aminotransferase class I/II-fold pyridoxal phosphate-dependent enzyme [Saprospiraceae bacterium]